MDGSVLLKILSGSGEREGMENPRFKLCFAELRRIGGYLTEDGLNLRTGLIPNSDKPFKYPFSKLYSVNLVLGKGWLKKFLEES